MEPTHPTASTRTHQPPPTANTGSMPAPCPQPSAKGAGHPLPLLQELFQPPPSPPHSAIRYRCPLPSKPIHHLKAHPSVGADLLLLCCRVLINHPKQSYRLLHALPPRAAPTSSLHSLLCSSPTSALFSTSARWLWVVLCSVALPVLDMQSTHRISRAAVCIHPGGCWLPSILLLSNHFPTLILMRGTNVSLASAGHDFVFCTVPFPPMTLRSMPAIALRAAPALTRWPSSPTHT